MNKSVEEALGSLGNITQRRVYDAKGANVDWGDIFQFYFIWGVLCYALADDECYKGSSLVVLVSLFALGVGDYQRINNHYIWTTSLPYATFELSELIKWLFPGYVWFVMTFFALRHYSFRYNLATHLAELRGAEVVTPELLKKVSTTLESLTKKRKDDVVIGWFARLIIFLVLISAFQFMVVTIAKSE